MAEYDPSKTSAAYDAMASHWQTARAVLGGVETMRAAGTRYLPQLPRESDADYRYRLAASPFVNLYVDLMSALATKPFANEVGLSADTPKPIVDLAEDIDGAGNNLHVFSERLFFSGINDAISWILVDFTQAPPDLTIAEERALGVRPHWVLIEAPDMLSVRFATVDGQQQVIEARIAESATVTAEDGTDHTAERVRIIKREKTTDGYAPATWQLWEKQKRVDNQGFTWVLIDGGPITIGIVPLVPLVAGRQAGQRLVPVLGDVLQLQVELWQRESALKAARTMTAFPMLAASGIEAPTNGETITVGPGTVLYGPSSGDGKAASWSFIEPAATSLKFLADDIGRLEAQMRELGRRPLTADTSGITIVAASYAASQANSVVEALALNLKDTLEQAFIFTALWLKIETSVEVKISTDFDIGLLDTSGADTLLKLRETGDLSQRTLWSEMRRRNILSPEFSPEAEEAQIINEMPGDGSMEDHLAAITH
jgi:hypothetical protein